MGIEIDEGDQLTVLLHGLPYQDLTEQRCQFLVHQLNAGFELLQHRLADV